MRVPGILGLFIAAVACSDSAALAAQPAADRLAVEVEAVRTMVERVAGHLGHTPRAIGVDSLLAKAGQAPASAAGTRPTARSTALAARVGGRLVAGAEADRCLAARCDGPAIDTFLSLSDPVVGESTATVTITARYRHRSAPAAHGGYETVALTLVRDGSRWRVTDVVQLGIS